jgi:hypothetical protein
MSPVNMTDEAAQWLENRVRTLSNLYITKDKKHDSSDINMKHVKEYLDILNSQRRRKEHLNSL